MSHANARLTFHGRCLLVRRVRLQGRPVAHVAAELGVSRQCAHRWVRRSGTGGWAGLHDRSSAPHRVAGRTPAAVEAQVVAARRALRRGPAFLAEATGVPERTVSRILRRAGEPPLAACDPLTGQVIRASKATAVRYERDRSGELVHLDVKKLGKIPDGGGWRANGRPGCSTTAHRRARTGYDYIHAAVDDCSRLAYAEALPDEKGRTRRTRAYAHRPPTTVAFTEKITINTGKITGLTPISLSTGDSAQAKGQTLTFAITSQGQLNGFQFTAKQATSITAILKVNATAATASPIYLGGTSTPSTTPSPLTFTR